MTTIICPCCNHHIRNNTDIEIFWSYVDKIGVPPNPQKDCQGNCWIWNGTIDHKGYGSLYGGAKRVRAHRYSYTIANPAQSIDGYYVCHKCDNPLCVNPKHLFLGTAKDNYDDMFVKGRSKLRERITPLGEDNPNSKITNQIVEKVLSLSQDGYSGRAIAKVLELGSTTVSNILDGKTWTHISGKDRKRGSKGPMIGSNHPQATFTEDIIRAIRKDSEDGISYKALSQKYDSKISTIRDIVKRKTWQQVKT